MLMEQQKEMQGEPVFAACVLTATDPDWCKGFLPAGKDIWRDPILGLNALREVFDRADGLCQVLIYIPEPIAWITAQLAAGAAPARIEAQWCHMAEMALGLSIDHRVELAVIGQMRPREVGPSSWVDLVTLMICRNQGVAGLLERISLVSSHQPRMIPEGDLDRIWSELTLSHPFQSVPQEDLQACQLRIDRLEQTGGNTASLTLMQERLMALQKLAEDSHRYALEMKHEVEALQNSRSWRITAPIRRVADGLRNLRR